MNSLKSRNLGAALALPVLLASCGGGGGVPTASVPPVPSATTAPQTAPSPQATAAANATATATFTIAVPPNISTSTSARQSMYVSPNTNSVAINVNAVNGKAAAGTPSVTKIGYGQSGCTAASTQPLTCTVSMTVPAQAYDTITVSTFSSQDGSGTPLSTTTLTQTFAANQTTNVPLSVGGVVASIAISPSVIHTVQGAARTPYLLSVTAKDASGAVILGTTPFQSPISLSVQNDPNNSLNLTESTITAPGTPVQVYYDGTKTLADGRIVASAGSLGAATADVIPLSFAPISLSAQMGSAVQQIAVSEAQFTGQFTASVDQPSIATVNLTPTGPGTATLSVLPAPLGGMAGNAKVTISDGTRVATIPVKVTLPPLPGITYSGPFTAFSPFWITAAPSGKIYMSSVSNAIEEFDPASGTVTPYSLSSFGFGLVTGIAVDGSGNVWVAKDNVPATLCELTIPAHTTACYNTGISSKARIYGVTLGGDGAIWFADNNTPAIGRIDPVTHVITEYTAGLGSSAKPYGIVDGGNGNVYFSDVSLTAPAFGSANIATGAIAEYTAGVASGSAPYRIARSASGDIWAADSAAHAIDQFIVSQHTTVQHTNGIQQYGNPIGIASAPNGDVWFTDAGFFAPDALGDVNTSTSFIQEYGGFPSQASGSVNGLVFTSPHDIWFFDQLAHSMGHVSI